MDQPIRFVVCGMGKEEIARAVRDSGGPAVEARVTSDFEAAAAINGGAADYYIGACQSGAGGALAVAIAVLGFGNVARLSGVGSSGVDPTAVTSAVAEGKRAFGIAHSHVAVAVPLIVRTILEQRTA
jgi:hypothetical protein